MRALAMHALQKKLIACNLCAVPNLAFVFNISALTQQIEQIAPTTLFRGLQQLIFLIHQFMHHTRCYKYRSSENMETRAGQ
jgi:hypothetical protein